MAELKELGTLVVVVGKAVGLHSSSSVETVNTVANEVVEELAEQISIR